MATYQLDLFNWFETQETMELPSTQTTSKIDGTKLGNALIKHFGHWVDSSPRLLGDDWTVCETLIGIHHVFTREQLLLVDEETWGDAWQRFESYYLTKRPRSDLFRSWPDFSRTA